MNARTPLTRAKWLIGCAVASIAIGAHAQSTGESADELLQAANKVFRQLEAGQFNDIWLDSADFIKTRFKQDQFVTDIRRAWQTVALVRHREWEQISRNRYTNATVPDGLYANVDYVTTLTTGTTVYEKVSFHLDNDGHWHLTGYAPRMTRDVAK
ncbi:MULTISPECIES: DUF4019 domain-containing protein [Burkholderia]|uniref:DUF4019 domain-containing protein n=1 Tax=Burkholderia contaminans TaxID=488447 RepID=A0A2S5E5T1_9BURK|nr:MULTISPECIES: DUF4019 domain-containing protein [Burkholderia]EKS9796152.1 DUF4019 domain-containing protein [Burkholderia cepacia]EKS9806070.1 DUF4019 domain-containing protein [Burkholderia cepacia]EKS9814473.1 DUF4019 domain-containing protein [Burkholderia cepacia]EKS9821793.1 DUF4019 domain-containing protein [Burkholderia cepacia]EKS9829414.1 DUF4019 domain-containing protein [Burkholderia cepacia]